MHHVRTLPTPNNKFAQSRVEHIGINSAIFGSGEEAAVFHTIFLHETSSRRLEAGQSPIFFSRAYFCFPFQRKIECHRLGMQPLGADHLVSFVFS